MRSAGALFASIGTSVMLVAAITLSLLSASAVFALGGFDGPADASSGDALVLSMHRAAGSHRAAAARAVAVVDRPRSKPHAPSGSGSTARRLARPRDTVSAAPASTQTTRPRSSHVAALGGDSAGTPPVSPHPTSQPPPVKHPPQTLGDGVRQLGDGLSSAVQQTGTRLAQTTAPLGAPVSVAVQQLLNIVAAVIKSTTDGLGGLLAAKP